MALTRIGQSRIASLDQAGSLAELSTLYYKPTLNELLSSYEWPFAIARVHLSSSAEENLTSYGYKYQIPTDVLRVLTILNSEDYSETDDKWETEGDKLLSDANPVYIKYIGKVDDPTRLPQVFIEALYLRIASKMVVKITQDQSLLSMIFQEYMAAYQSAIAYLGGNSQSEKAETEWWTD